MWAFACGVVSSGASIQANWITVVLGLILVGPLVCAMSQAINDWYDRDVDAINEPNRPIPSGRVPGQWGLYIAAIWTGLSLLLASVLGTWVLLATIAGLALAWAYSAPPLRFKQNGWLGMRHVGFPTRDLTWVTGGSRHVLVACCDRHNLLSLFGVPLLHRRSRHSMTLKRFQGHQGGREMGSTRCPCPLLGPGTCRHTHVSSMALPQFVYSDCLLVWMTTSRGIVAALTCRQLLMMRRLYCRPGLVVHFGTAALVPLFVLGMMARRRGRARMRVHGYH
ncbi:UNVERIFIED_CONTAM: hypothetical protein GTU68_036359 [Idotea baltica]|nr:hypothetical protein [Idotea baltica]